MKVQIGYQQNPKDHHGKNGLCRILINRQMPYKGRNYGDAEPYIGPFFISYRNHGQDKQQAPDDFTDRQLNTEIIGITEVPDPSLASWELKVKAGITESNRKNMMVNIQ